MDLAFQGLDTEIQHFASHYGRPDGGFYLAITDGAVSGGAGFRSWGDGVCEMKRLYVYPGFRGKGMGRGLCEHLIQEAARAGYESMRLDTPGPQEAARSLYRALGSREIAPYRYNPDPEAVFLEPKLSYFRVCGRPACGRQVQGARGFRSETYLKYVAATGSEAPVCMRRRTGRQHQRCCKIGNPGGFQILMIESRPTLRLGEPRWVVIQTAPFQAISLKTMRNSSSSKFETLNLGKGNLLGPASH